MKDTQLDDSSALFNHRESKNEKEKWSSLSGKEKLQYFKDYYLKFVLLFLVLLVLIISFIISIITKKETALTLTLVNGVISEETADDIASMLSKSLDLNQKKETVLIDQTLYTDSSDSEKLSDVSEQKLSVYFYSGQYDLIIAEQSIIEHYASLGYFCNLEEFLPSDLNNTFSPSYLYTKGSNDTDSADTKLAAYGISLKDFQGFSSLIETMHNPVIAVSISTKHKNESLLALRSFLDN
ncbi:MAG: hypothetical protein ACERKN_16990 [Velocimicrobium sp.]